MSKGWVLWALVIGGCGGESVGAAPGNSSGVDAGGRLRDSAAPSAGDGSHETPPRRDAASDSGSGTLVESGREPHDSARVPHDSGTSADDSGSPDAAATPVDGGATKDAALGGDASRVTPDAGSPPYAAPDATTCADCPCRFPTLGLKAVDEQTASYAFERMRALERELEQIGADFTTAFTHPTENMDGRTACVQASHSGSTTYEAGSVVEMSVGGCDGGPVEESFRMHVSSGSLDENLIFGGWYHLAADGVVDIDAERQLDTGEWIHWKGSIPFSHRYDIYNWGHASVQSTHSQVTLAMSTDSGAHLSAMAASGALFEISGGLSRRYSFASMPGTVSSFDLAAKDAATGVAIGLASEGDFYRIDDPYPVTGSLLLVDDGWPAARATYGNAGSTISGIGTGAWSIPTSNEGAPAEVSWPAGAVGACGSAPTWK
ncbi:MAG TPA: hypothetical protein VHE30_18945 [Polyangiaceae bacterium]|nr:hypothetical protein [Polyangiaceae bacterium]